MKKLNRRTVIKMNDNFDKGYGFDKRKESEILKTAKVYVSKENAELILLVNNRFIDKYGITFNLEKSHLIYLGKL